MSGQVKSIKKCDVQKRGKEKIHRKRGIYQLVLVEPTVSPAVSCQERTGFVLEIRRILIIQGDHQQGGIDLSNDTRDDGKK